MYETGRQEQILHYCLQLLSLSTTRILESVRNYLKKKKLDKSSILEDVATAVSMEPYSLMSPGIMDLNNLHGLW